VEVSQSVGGNGVRGLEVDGATAEYVQAPPVNDPGGANLFLRQVSDPAPALASAQHNAAAQGNPLVVVSQMAGDAALVETLETSGFRRHCDFMQGRVAVR
jgi:hypothetical protein